MASRRLRLLRLRRPTARSCSCCGSAWSHQRRPAQHVQVQADCTPALLPPMLVCSRSAVAALPPSLLHAPFAALVLSPHPSCILCQKLFVAPSMQLPLPMACTMHIAVQRRTPARHPGAALPAGGYRGAGAGGTPMMGVEGEMRWVPNPRPPGASVTHPACGPSISVLQQALPRASNPHTQTNSGCRLCAARTLAHLLGRQPLRSRCRLERVPRRFIKDVVGLLIGIQKGAKRA